MNKTLYEIENELDFISEGLFNEDGEILNDDKFDLFEKLAGERDEKVLKTGKYIKSLRLWSKTLKEEKARINAQMVSANKKIQALEERLLVFWTGDKVQDSQIQIKRNFGTVEIDDEKDIPKEFLEEEIKIKVLKNEIKNQFKLGKEIAGCHIKQTLGLK